MINILDLLNGIPTSSVGLFSKLLRIPDQADINRTPNRPIYLRWKTKRPIVLIFLSYHAVVSADLSLTIEDLIDQKKQDRVGSWLWL